ncbi:unnamed protein product [Trypanosoma congolense IL3000]|uniref:non-specific serine/threonine protein kinase n=1 Tax=Trypanosoma congolense (strain IL3000) TaxID=1068625 RepID=F9W4S0_TRYCI|nr:unnamed protein product [Trypanosoma congolense IL3000]
MAEGSDVVEVENADAFVSRPIGMPPRRPGPGPGLRRPFGHRRTVSVFYEASTQSTASPTGSIQGVSTLNACFLNLPNMLDTVLNAPKHMVLPKERLLLHQSHVLGAGSFGEVVYGELLGENSVVGSHAGPNALPADNTCPAHHSDTGQQISRSNAVVNSAKVSPSLKTECTTINSLDGGFPEFKDEGLDVSVRRSVNTENGCSVSVTVDGAATLCQNITRSHDGDETSDPGRTSFPSSSSVSVRLTKDECTPPNNIPSFLCSPEGRTLSGGGSAAPVGHINGGGETPTILKLPRPVAIKRVDKSRLSRRQQFVVSFHSEIQISCTLEHPSVVRVHGVAEDDAEIFLVMELAEGGTLQDYVRRVSAEELRISVPRMIAEVVLALEHMYSLGIAHRDIKPGNILLTKDYRVKLGDFGTACYINDVAANAFGGTPAYVAPELVKTGKATSTSDLWSLGCVLFELFAGQTPFQGETHVLVMRLIGEYQDDSIEYPISFPADAKDLVQKLLRSKPCDRLGSKGTGGFTELKKHSFFASVDWSRYISKAGDTP